MSKLIHCAYHSGSPNPLKMGLGIWVEVLKIHFEVEQYTRQVPYRAWRRKFILQLLNPIEAIQVLSR